MKLIAPLLAVCAMLTSCATPGEGRSPLAGSAWQFTAIDNSTPVSSSARLTFEGDTIGVNVGCNGIGGPWRVDNGRLIAGPLMQTEMYCAGPVWDQEMAISALLAAAPRLDINGSKMIIKSRGHSAELQRLD